jgi:hypothetical protein
MPMVFSRVRATFLPLLFVALATALPLAASAQDAQNAPPGPRPVGRFAADARVSMPRFKADPLTAQAIGVSTENLPTRGFGLVLGAHVYPLRMGRVTLGLGGEIMRSRGSRTLEADEEDEPDGPTVETRFSTISPQLSLNFGASEGWSYISGGLGWSQFTVTRDVEPAPADPDPSPRRRTINYGGGARWFAKKHLAVSVDLRFYSVSALSGATTAPDATPMRLMVLSGGIAFK